MDKSSMIPVRNKNGDVLHECSTATIWIFGMGEISQMALWEDIAESQN